MKDPLKEQEVLSLLPRAGQGCGCAAALSLAANWRVSSADVQ